MKLLGILGFLSCVGAFFPHFSKTFRQPLHVLQMKNYPYSRSYYEHYVRRLNSKNITIQNQEILRVDDKGTQKSFFDDLAELYANGNVTRASPSGVRIIINPGVMMPGMNLGLKYNEPEEEDEHDKFYGSNSRSTKKKSDNFEVITKSSINFNDVGGYDNIKQELGQCIDILSNYTKYQGYNIRIPKGLIFEGPPGNGKTLFAKALAGEAGVGFIAVSGSEFQEKYVGVGSSRIRELFKLAKQNIPCIIFMDEIDAVGRKRSSDPDAASSERDSTLNELLVGLDGFKNTSGIFLIGATNRADLLDSALIRPGRIDKRIYIGNPDEKTRTAIFDIHKKGKPIESDVSMEELVEQSAGFSAAQIENLLNEGMLHALRNDRKKMNSMDLEIVLNKMMVGWQPIEHEFTDSIIDHIAIHELGHTIVGLLCKHHAPVTKVLINLSAPNSPGYTVFVNNKSPIMTREALFEHLMILLSGRIAEEVFFDRSITTGAINDFEESLKLAKKMIMYYGMGKNAVYPDMSEKYKEIVDMEVAGLIDEAYQYAEFLVRNSRGLIEEGAELLKRDKVVKAETLVEIMNEKYPGVAALKLKDI